MPEEIVYYVTKYGYLAILVLVFLQETGIPSPIPNELLLIFSGYLSYMGLLFIPSIIITAVSADFIGTNILYFLFYYTGTYIFQKKPKWIPLSSAMIDRLSTKIERGGQLGIFIFRLTPFTRGYTSVITGLIQIKPKVFLPIALLSSLLWSAFYVLIGYLLGPFWNLISLNIEKFKLLLFGFFVMIICIAILVYYFRKRKVIRTNSAS
jgi:membrane protein DedA with SNARE-associated domain